MADAKKVKIGGIWYNVKDETARNGLAGKVSKSGDKMTGQLQIDRAANGIAVVTRLTSSGRSSLPSSNETIYSSVITDKDMNWIGQIGHTLQTSGRVLFTIGAINKPTDSTIFNTLAFGIDQNGNLSIGVSSPAAWRNGLGASNGAWPTSVGGTGGTDSGWQSYTNASKFTGTINYRKVGVMLMVSSTSAKLNEQLNASSYIILGQLPSGYRPSVEMSMSCMFNTFSSNTLANLQIAADGTIYLFTNTNPISANNALRFSGFGFI